MPLAALVWAPACFNSMHRAVSASTFQEGKLFSLKSQLKTHLSKACGGGEDKPSMSLHDLSNLLRKNVMDLNRHTSSEACVGLGGARWWWDVIGVDWSHRWAMVTEEFHMVESEGKSYSGSESEASDSESEELALASEEGAESPYFSADIMASSESTDMVVSLVARVSWQDRGGLKFEVVEDR
jgi:hypothetical protein